MQKNESPNLDLLRSVAVLAVLADHIAGTFGIAQKHPFFWALGRWGVLLFFVHTSLVLMMSMERLGLSGLRLYTKFYIARFFRIYPLSVVTVAVVLAARIPRTSWDPHFIPPDLGTILSNFFLCQNLIPKPSVMGPLWSLPFEVQMYLLLPALFFFVRKATTRSLVGLWLGSVAIGWAQGWLAVLIWGVGRFGIAEFVPCFLAGVIAYFVLRQNPKVRFPFWVWCLTPFIVGVAYLISHAYVGFVGYPEWACCLVVGLVVVHCAESRYRGLNFLTHRVAKYSYGLYLGQVPVLWLAFVKLHDLPAYLQWCLFLFLIIAVPIASYHLIEKPFIKLGAAIANFEFPAKKVRPAAVLSAPFQLVGEKNEERG